MRTKTVYLSSDDEEHKTPEACEKHETILKLSELSGLYLQSFQKKTLVDFLFENYNMSPKIPQVTLEHLPND